MESFGHEMIHNLISCTPYSMPVCVNNLKQQHMLELLQKRSVLKTLNMALDIIFGLVSVQYDQNILNAWNFQHKSFCLYDISSIHENYNHQYLATSQEKLRIL